MVTFPAMTDPDRPDLNRCELARSTADRSNINHHANVHGCCWMEQFATDKFALPCLA